MAIVILVNYFSKWPVAMALPDKSEKSAEQVSLFLYQTFCKYAHACRLTTLQNNCFAQYYIMIITHNMYEM